MSPILASEFSRPRQKFSLSLEAFLCGSLEISSLHRASTDAVTAEKKFIRNFKTT